MERAAPKLRVNDTPLARFERWALPRMARRLPGWVTPDTLTWLGVVAAGLTGLGYILTAYGLGWLWLASFGFALHWWADSLDGTLARVRNIRRERYGFYVDHQCDAVSVLLIFGGLGVSPLMPLAVALLMLIGVYLLMILVHLVTVSRDVFKISFAGVGPTEGRAAMIALNTLVLALGNPTVRAFGEDWTLFGLLGVAATALLFTGYAVFSLLERATLARLDPTPVPGHDLPERPPPLAVEEPMGSR